MVDICLELPDAVIALFERRAALVGVTAEDLMREIIEAAAPDHEDESDADLASLADEPIVQAAEIEKEYQRLGYTAGWRFITCPQEQSGSAKLLLVSLNPAGTAPFGPGWSQELGSAYRVESWDGIPTGTARLQRQVQQLFELLGLKDSEVFSAHYVPFRSPSWETLDRRREAEAFAGSLWKWLKPKLNFDRIVCIGIEKPGKPIASLFDAHFEARIPVGWGSYSAHRYRLPDGRPLIALPHLSRYSVFGRKQSEEALRQIFELS